MKPNKQQQKAIDYIDGPLLIIAGAGSGKTATLTARVQNMIKKGIEPRNILMVTFTNKAANEMKSRVAKTLGVEIPKTLFSNKNFPTIGTFHSIGIYFLKIILNPSSKIFGNNFYEDITEKIGLKKDFIIYDETDKITILKNIIKKDLNLEEKEYPARQISFYISNAKNSLINAKQYASYIDNSFKEVVGKVYEIYEKKLKQNNAIDFDDILLKTYSLLKIKQVLEYFWSRYHYLMVDEYQDTNAPQYEIVKLLALKNQNLAVVGDDSQSIYSWRGANLQNILNFKKDYSNALIIKLEQNYRSTKNIIKGANYVIKNNNTGIKKELWTENIEGDKISYIEAIDDRQEAKTIVKIIKEKKQKENSNYSENLILYRTNSQSRILEEALMMENIPYKVIGGLKFYDRKEIKDILAYLKAIFNKDDIISYKRIINTPTRKIGAKSIEILDNYKDNFGINYLEILENVEEIEELKPAGKKALKIFYDLMSYLIKKSNEVEVAELIREILKYTKYEEYITNGLSQEEKESKKSNIKELINMATQYNGMGNRESLSQFLEEVALLTDLDKQDEDKKDYVTLMTIHTSKGLEEERVFVGGLEDGLFPSFRSISDSNALEEERRLMYVAMTRAKKELYLSRAKERFNFGEYIRNPESRFLKEIPDELLDYYTFEGTNNFFSTGLKVEEKNLGTNTNKKLVRKVANNDISQFKKGDKIKHPKFGSGIIISLKGEIADIAFSGIGVKKMSIKIAPIKKL